MGLGGLGSRMRTWTSLCHFKGEPIQFSEQQSGRISETSLISCKSSEIADPWDSLVLFLEPRLLEIMMLGF